MKAMKNWNAELTAGGKTISVMRNIIGIFQADAPLPLLFVITIMPHNCILKKRKVLKENRDSDKNN